jgi:hypothetical protein
VAELTFEQAQQNCRAIPLGEGAIAAVAECVNCNRDDLFAGARLPFEEPLSPSERRREFDLVLLEKPGWIQQRLRIRCSLLHCPGTAAGVHRGQCTRCTLTRFSCRE